ncbi:hypothetical protein DITRI_Ditri07aG0087700 [Diplodiscus trichospermus]
MQLNSTQVGIMDRSWMLERNKFSTKHIQGVRSFLDLAQQHTDSNGRIRCPGKNCNNCYFKQIVDVRRDLFHYGFVENYTQWIHHGEPFQSDGADHFSNSYDADNSGNQVED